MANTTFSGPVRAGPIFQTTGTTLGQNIKNVGQVVMAQSQKVTQLAGGGATDIVIPAHSQILRITLYVTTVWGATATAGIGNTALATAYTAAGAVSTAAVGVVDITPGTDATRTAAFVDVGATDVKILLTSTTPGAGGGEGYLTVEYLQFANLIP
jgi:hypothetical protein